MPSRAELQRALRQTAPQELTALYNLAIDAVAAGLAEDVVECLSRSVADGCRDARLWQMLGVAHRDLGQSAEAHHAFAEAQMLAPDNPLIAHGLARTAMEAGYRASALFDRAMRLAPADGSVLMGRAAAQLAEGDGAAALGGLAHVLASNPGWIEGHLTYARLQAVFDPQGDRTITLRTAIMAAPQQVQLWLALARAHSGANDYAGALTVLDAAASHGLSGPALDASRAICLAESGAALEAQAIFARLPVPASGDEALWPVRNLIRLGRYDEALALAEVRHAMPGDHALWPYRALLWRLLGDARWEWLESDPRLIGVYDLSARLDLPMLAEVLRGLHISRAQPLEQSVRGGTQTDGALFARAEPEICALRDAIRETVAQHIAQLPPCDPAHPTLGTPRGAIRFAGSWSVRLSGSGHHSDHVHTHGWLSSALYIALPDEMKQPGEAGCLAFGECRALLPQFEGFRLVHPEPGQLVLFPSTMWHGTRPFARGERLTVAFDVAQPQGEA